MKHDVLIISILLIVSTSFFCGCSKQNNPIEKNEMNTVEKDFFNLTHPSTWAEGETILNNTVLKLMKYSNGTEFVITIKAYTHNNMSQEEYNQYLRSDDYLNSLEQLETIEDIQLGSILIDGINASAFTYIESNENYTFMITSVYLIYNETIRLSINYVSQPEVFDIIEDEAKEIIQSIVLKKPGFLK